jgi:hypothetical protein
LIFIQLYTPDREASESFGVTCGDPHSASIGR